jgi:hypothetical protein
MFMSVCISLLLIHTIEPLNIFCIPFELCSPRILNWSFVIMINYCTYEKKFPSLLSTISVSPPTPFCNRIKCAAEFLVFATYLFDFFDKELLDIGLQTFFFNSMPDIADVANFVHPGMALDNEAAQRGTSVYLVERRIDMLPKPLTEGMYLLPVSMMGWFSVMLTLEEILLKSHKI